MNNKYRIIALLIGFSLLSGCVTSTISSNNKPSNIVIDGLVKVKDWNIDQVLVKPGFAPATYSNIMIEGKGIDFRSVKDRYTPYSHSSENYPLNNTDQQRYKEIVIDAFTKELKKSDAYKFTDQAGPNTLQLDMVALKFNNCLDNIQ